jgi:hypothetical protein
MKKTRFIWACALALAAGSALAGATNPQPVKIDLDVRQAEGDMATARFAKNDVELIGCGINYVADGVGGAFVFGFCQAVDANDVYAVCFTQDPGLVEAIQSISDFSFIRFDWDEYDFCTRIDISTQSLYVPNFTRKGSDN